MKTEFDSLLDYKDIHKGKRGILVAPGPSLDNFDFNKIKQDDVVLAVNNAVTALKYCNYFCMTDGGIITSNYFFHGVNICKKKVAVFGPGFFQKKTKHILEKIEDEKTLVLNRRYNQKNNCKFGLDDGLLIAGTDIVHVTSHFAYILGCSPIYLVGVDLNYSNNNKYCKPKTFGKKVQMDKNYPKSYLKTQKSGLSDTWLNSSFQYWKKIKKQNPNVTFINTNPDGRLAKIFETRNLENDFKSSCTNPK